MSVCEEVIVTLNFSDPVCSYDVELPSFMNIYDLKKKLLETLRLMDARLFLRADSIELFYNDSKLKNEYTLANYGIWDGNYIEVKVNRPK